MIKSTLLTATLLVALTACDLNRSDAPPQGSNISNIAADEHVVFFRTSAWRDQSLAHWHVPIHGWIYEPEDSVARKELFETILADQYGLAVTKKTDENFSRRLNLIIADNERGKKIVVQIAGREYTLPASEANGQFQDTLTIPASDVEEFAVDSRLRFSAVVSQSDRRQYLGDVLLIEPNGISVISDIDDTVKISMVRDKKSLLEQTFLLDFAAVPSMSDTYNAWSDLGTSFHFVSSSPWQLYDPLNDFFSSTGFPDATYSLKSVRFRDETLFDLFKKGTETKPPAIERILAQYPKREFILVGDSGEQDPEVYAALAEKYPDQILKVYIRNVSGESADNQRFTSSFATVDKKRWQLFDDAATLTLP